MTPQAQLLEPKPHVAPIDDLLAIFRSHPRFLLASHTRPDGDAIGSVLALAEVLDQIGCQADIVFADPIPSSYSSLPNVGRIHHTPSANNVDPTGTTPAILLECDGIARTGLLGLEGRTLINIDHHSSTTADTFALVHHLASCGANPSQIARDIYLSNPASKIRLLGIALSNLQCDDDLAWTWVTSKDMDGIGATAEDCEGVVNYLISIAGVESAVFLREVPNADQFRLSIRSKGKTDVARIAEFFGGGGHRNASGCTLDGPLPVALEQILTRLRTGL
jgi:bifunctional oligoribonuclease and PAP phosphatase NrnA